MSKSPENLRQPLISVVTVTRNLIEEGREETILSALNSVQSQSFRDVEHVIWDGKSTDGTQELLKQAIKGISTSADCIPVRYFCEPDQSLYDAMNKAVELCAGEYILFLNSDDLIPGDDCLLNISNAIKGTRPDFIYGETIFVDEDGSQRHARRLTIKSILQRMPFGHNAMLIRKSLFQQLGGHDLRFRIVADYDMLLRMILAGHQGHKVQTPLSLFRKGGVSADADAVGAEMAECWRKNFGEFCDMSGYDESQRIEWFRKGQLPVRVSSAILLKSLAQPMTAHAALFSLAKTLRRSVQFWRRY
ncbi:glycosyltransferase family 2 protein [Ruegeria lacuscaerulensis]|uniref:glycosyltransferase family 2 protein n=1 Tax=Ruegeria lacuscaerulensis TaxID=55218 RepID=UPI0014806290|nr:glycosyltransferase family 2 protein [Ruegeria lacuscaerulensis]